MSDWWHPTTNGLEIFLRVVPGARRSEVVVEESMLRVRVAAPAVEGRANDELRRTIASWCGVRTNAVTIVRGDHSRDKVVEVRGIDSPPTTSAG